jgi:hypothetical protein
MAGLVGGGGGRSLYDYFVFVFQDVSDSLPPLPSPVNEDLPPLPPPMSEIPAHNRDLPPPPPTNPARQWR